MCNQWIIAKSEDPPDKNQWNSSWWLITRKGRIAESALFINGRWTQDNGDVIYDTTHWMPLPNTPETDTTRVYEDGLPLCPICGKDCMILRSGKYPLHGPHGNPCKGSFQYYDGSDPLPRR